MVLLLDSQPLARVSSLLRRQGSVGLSRLLANATVDFEWYDEGYPLDGSPEITLVSAVVNAPGSDYDKLRSISSDDSNEILEAIRAVWPSNDDYPELIYRISFQLDAQSLDEEPLILLQETVGWSHIDDTLNAILARLAMASDEDAYAEVGLLCRRVLVELGRTIFDPEKHPPLGTDDSNVGPDDIKRIAGRFLSVEMAGPAQQIARQCVRSAVQLASELVHSTNSTYRDAMLCAQATFNSVGLLRIVARNRETTGNSRIELSLPSPSVGFARKPNR